MIADTILLKKTPKIEFRLLDQGFQLTDEQTERNSGFYSYQDLQFIELNKPWFPKLAKWLRIITWILNAVPFFPDADSYKNASVIIHFKTSKLGVWLTDTYMADKAKILKQKLDNKSKHNEG